MYSRTLFIVETSLSGIVGIRRQRDVGGREVGQQLVVRDPPGERHAVVQAELGRQRAHLVEAVARADERGVPVVRPEGSQRRERLERVVDAVLRAHDAEVAQEMLLPRLSAGSGAAAEAAQVGAVRTTNTRSGTPKQNPGVKALHVASGVAGRNPSLPEVEETIGCPTAMYSEILFII